MKIFNNILLRLKICLLRLCIFNNFCGCAAIISLWLLSHTHTHTPNTLLDIDDYLVSPDDPIAIDPSNSGELGLCSPAKITPDDLAPIADIKTPPKYPAPSPAKITGTTVFSMTALVAAPDLARLVDPALFFDLSIHDLQEFFAGLGIGDWNMLHFGLGAPLDRTLLSPRLVHFLNQFSATLPWLGAGLMLGMTASKTSKQGANAQLDELRSLLYERASSENWRTALELVTTLSDNPDTQRVAIDYIQHSIAAWPDDIKTCPPELLEIALRGESNPSLELVRHLDLSRSLLGDNSTRAYTPDQLQTILAHPQLRNITVLNLSKHNLGPKGIELLAPVLAQLKLLKELNLGFNNLGPEGARHLATVLGQLEQLTHLDLAWNNLGPEGARHLATVLGQLEQLTHLDLAWNNLGPEGARHLATVLGQLTQLTALVLSYNNLGLEGARHLATVLGQLTQLTALVLSGNALGSQGVWNLEPALARLTLLTQLFLADNNIRSEFIRVLRDHFQTNYPNLRIYF